MFIRRKDDAPVVEPKLVVLSESTGTTERRAPFVSDRFSPKSLAQLYHKPPCDTSDKGN